MIVDPKGKPASSKPNGKSELVTAESPFASMHRAIVALASAQRPKEKQVRARACMTHLAAFERSFIGVSAALGEAHRALLEATGGEFLNVRLEQQKLPPGAGWRIVDQEGTPLPIVHAATGKVLALPSHVRPLVVEVRFADGTVKSVAPKTQPGEPGLDPAKASGGAGADASSEAPDDASPPAAPDASPVDEEDASLAGERDTLPVPGEDEEVLEEEAARFEEEDRESRFESPLPMEEQVCDDCGAPLALTGDENPDELCASCFADLEELGA